MAEAAPSVQLAPVSHLLDQIKFLVAKLTVSQPVCMPTLAGQRGAEPSLLLYQADDIQIGLEVVDDPESRQKQYTVS